MKVIYEIFIILTYLICQPLRIFSSKINLFFKGRNDSFKILEHEVDPSNNNIWIHVSSLGEFEIAIPIIDSLKSKIDNLKVVVTFFSPSGFENSKNYKNADSKVYLPLDSSRNAKKFIQIVNPKIAVFIKNDIWSNYITFLKKNNSIIYSVSSKFNKSQFYFKFFGFWFLKKLKKIDFFFVQDENSKNVLKKHLTTNISVSGDSRFTSVLKTLKSNKEISKIERFINSKKCFIAGSIWESDIKLMDETIKNKIEKSIIAPHDISPKFIDQLENLFAKNSVRLSCLKSEDDFKRKILIIDSIGVLKYIYKYGYVSYVGGGMSNNGLHNILEPAVFSCPVIIGNNYKGYNEAEDLIKLGGAFTVKDAEEFSKIFTKLNDSEKNRQRSGEANLNYIMKNAEKNSLVLKSLIENLH